MRTRLVGFGLAAVVAGLPATHCGAKPPDTPVNPHVQGKELPPVARDHHKPDGGDVTPSSFPLPMPPRPNAPRPASGRPVDQVADALLNGFTVPLGVVDRAW